MIITFGLSRHFPLPPVDVSWKDKFALENVPDISVERTWTGRSAGETQVVRAHDGRVLEDAMRIQIESTCIMCVSTCTV